MRVSRVRSTALALLALVFALAGCGGSTGPSTPRVIDVAPGEDLVAAVAAAPTRATLQLAAASYDVAGTLRIVRDLTIVGTPDTVLRGTGPAGAALRPQSPEAYGAPVVYVEGADVTLRDLAIVYEGAAEATVVVIVGADYDLRRVRVEGGVHEPAGRTLGDGLLLQDARGTLDQVTSSGNGWNGVTVVGGELEATNVTVEGNGASGLAVNAASANVEGLVAEGNANGLYLLAGSTTSVAGSATHASVSGNVGNGAIALGDATATLDALVVAGNEQAGFIALDDSTATLTSLTVEDNANSGVVFAGASTGSVSDSIVRRSGWSGAELTGDARATLVRVDLDGNGRSGLYVGDAGAADAADGTLTNNAWDGATFADASSGDATGNTVEGNGWCGLRFADQSTAGHADNVVGEHPDGAICDLR
jgi:hypothetical protein